MARSKTSSDGGSGRIASLKSTLQAARDQYNAACLDENLAACRSHGRSALRVADSLHELGLGEKEIRAVLAPDVGPLTGHVLANHATAWTHTRDPDTKQGAYLPLHVSFNRGKTNPLAVRGDEVPELSDGLHRVRIVPNRDPSGGRLRVAIPEEGVEDPMNASSDQIKAYVRVGIDAISLKEDDCTAYPFDYLEEQVEAAANADPNRHDDAKALSEGETVTIETVRGETSQSSGVTVTGEVTTTRSYEDTSAWNTEIRTESGEQKRLYTVYYPEADAYTTTFDHKPVKAIKN